MALLKYRKANGEISFHCGGSVITNRYIVIAAHCIELIASYWQLVGVRLGEYDLSNAGPDCKEGVCANVPVDVGIEKIIVHDSYASGLTAQYNDIALIRTDRIVTFSKFIHPICLPVDEPERSLNNVGKVATAAGWGRTKTGFMSNVKLKVDLNITETTKCLNLFRMYNVKLRYKQLCAGGKRGEDTCAGDSGGPLMRLIKSNYYMFGIVSFGPEACGTQGVPGVYTNVVQYLDWIESKLE
ncbi:CLIP domain-containing serine protease B4-like [Wyeomyia smithii]|uniref:CLIP domain-containing serine protease B4-like n=1 Tax=Wyeomyia smithii TaxID=174621 RepID=UPI002467D82C|nr:CLIP domain-containing serine protease B4-like [Wyeomyia smithii]XP_055550369.1 CLIP domain-containing serine protease B4-like [Wyeomyia smithii]XP_055550370.1 CLIP domain-containing serine protease B4-like [Wyeomyia smithii]XP_055550371.1 CLIP domain-containing serine protease B4-like [Wyeomyia smithii]XP_055550372.1 CLIP domain-containing serine protease B4-like [Wyeomyia smithii]XP_055550373.1 CLIP domain-containing serine protease B4-like [Wyeomyia smithii]XP_055550375.1 CLIP domain-co